MHWRLLLEEYGPNIIYVPGKANVIADLLSRYPVVEKDTTETNNDLFTLTPVEGGDEFPMIPAMVQNEQKLELNKNELLRLKIRKNKDFTYKVIATRAHLVKR